MKEAKIVIYDGSFNGFLTTIFKVFNEQIKVADIQKNSVAQRVLFSDTETVFTQMTKAKRVWNGIQRKSNTSIKNVYFAFLSESNGIEMLLYKYIQNLFNSTTSVNLNFYTSDFAKINQLAKSVSKEKQQIEAFNKFKFTQDGVYFTAISPDFDILPLISKHFRSRHSNQQWLVYDIKRKYGIFYDLNTVEIIALDTRNLFTTNLDFSSIEIKLRINRKLHTSPIIKHNSKFLREKKRVV